MKRIIQYRVIIQTKEKQIYLDSKTFEKAKKTLLRNVNFLKKFSNKKVWGTVEKMTIEKEFVLDSDYKKLRVKTKKGILLES